MNRLYQAMFVFGCAGLAAAALVRVSQGPALDERFLRHVIPEQQPSVAIVLSPSKTEIALSVEVSNQLRQYEIESFRVGGVLLNAHSATRRRAGDTIEFLWMLDDPGWNDLDAIGWELHRFSAWSDGFSIRSKITGTASVKHDVPRRPDMDLHR